MTSAVDEFSNIFVIGFFFRLGVSHKYEILWMVLPKKLTLSFYTALIRYALDFC